MIQFCDIDPFSMDDADVHVRVNTVNTVGVMGKGIALEFKKRYPAMLEAYRDVCKYGLLQPGMLHFWHDPSDPKPIIVNMATKANWKHPSKYEWVSAGLSQLALYLQCRMSTVVMPMPGCGNGGLDPTLVSKMIVDLLAPVTHGSTVIVCRK